MRFSTSFFSRKSLAAAALAFPLLSSACLDTKFSRDGYDLMSPLYYYTTGDEVEARGVAMQGINKAKEKIIVAGNTEKSNGESGFALFRYNTNGRVDRVFGNKGIAATSFKTDGTPTSAALNAIHVYPRPDGRIIAVGSRVSTADTNPKIAMARYTNKGRVDTTFGTNGIKTDNWGGTGYQDATSVKVLADGKILVCGQFYYTFENAFYAGCARYNSDGAADTAFGLPDTPGRAFYSLAVPPSSGGPVTTAFVESMVTAANGDIAILVGYALSSDAQQRLRPLLLRLNSDGIFTQILADYQFGFTMTLGTLGDYLSDKISKRLLLDSNGKYVVIGYSNNGARDFAITRILSTGGADASYGTNGLVMVDIGTAMGGAASDDKAISATLDASGRLAVVGSSNGNFAGVRLLASGAIDSNAGIKAVVVDSEFGEGASDAARAVTIAEEKKGRTITPDAKLVVVGTAIQGGKQNIAIAQFKKTW